MGNPYASVVICTVNKPDNVIRDLGNQSFKDFEIIIASEKGIVNAMNLALNRARGEILVRVDDDVEIPTTWLTELLKPFKDPWVAGVTGPTFVKKDRRSNRDSIRMWEKPNCFLKWLADGCEFNPAGIYRCGMVSYDSNYAERFGYPTQRVADHLEGTNWAMRKSLIKSVGGFDRKFDGVCEWFDTDVEFKIKKQGYDLIYQDSAWLIHNLEKGGSYKDRFDGFGRIKNWIRFHKRHSKFHWKMVVFLMVWVGYFIQQGFKRCLN